MATRLSRSMSGGGSGRQTILWILLVVALAGFVWSFLNYLGTSKQVAILSNPKLASELSKKQTAELLGKLSKLMVLPPDKAPVVATINDVETLASTQDFYLRAHNGDKLIIFSASKKALIYDEKANIIVNVGPIVYNDPETEKKIADITTRLGLEIRNGTSNSSAAVNARNKISGNDSFEVLRLGKAAKTDYPASILVDLTGGKKPEAIAALKKSFGIQTVVTEMPQGEAATSSEAVLIIGAK